MFRNHIESIQTSSGESEPSDVEGLLKNIVPGDPYLKIEGDTLIASGEMGFIHNMHRKAHKIIRLLEKDSRFEEISTPKTDSRVSIFANLKEPDNGISKVEIYINKDY